MHHNRVADYDSSIRRPPLPSGSSQVEWQQLAGERGRQALVQFERFISENPKACLGIGLAVGVLLGWLVKRR